MSPATQNNYLVAHLKTLLPLDSRSSLCDSVLPTLLQSIGAVAQALRDSSNVSQVGTANAFGDDQLNVDVIAEGIIRSALSQCPSIHTASSEEDPVERQVTTSAPSSNPESQEKYSVAFDPLDGSSIIEPNWTVGTIIGIWEGVTALQQDPSSKQVAAILGIYGPRTSAIVALRLPGCTPTCFEVAIGDGRDLENIEVVRQDIRLQAPPFKTRYFAPANLRAAAEDARYMDLISHFVGEKYTLRYSGGLVPDVVHALVKGHGVYVSPVTGKSKAKLRRLFELAPVALIVECAGGLAIDSSDGGRILGRPVRDIDERGGLICGTREEVEFVRGKLIPESQGGIAI
jgi:sedoheptulose-bisphosphatase